MILPGHILSELRSQNRAAHTRTTLQNKTSGPGIARTKKSRAEAPFQKGNGCFSAINSRESLRELQAVGHEDI